MTYRSPNRKIELEGIRYIQSVVQNSNSIFQAIDLENDQGNDCYIEFVVDNKATSWSVFVQIKSGNTYKDTKGYKIPADKQHLKYWSDPLCPIIGIVYDPEIKKAFWVSISDYLKSKPQVLNNSHHTIRVSSKQEFSETTFPLFVEYFMHYIKVFKNFENFGRSLDMFSNVDDPVLCNEGLKALYANHRDRVSSWFYIAASFGKIQHERIRKNILGFLSNCIDNPYILWHAQNIQYLPCAEMQEQIAKLLTINFGIEEVKLMLPYLREGVLVGDFSYLVVQVIGMIRNIHHILRKLAFEPNLDSNERNHVFWLYLHKAKYYSTEDTLLCADEYLSTFPFGYEDEAIIGTIENIRRGELLPIGQF